MSAGQQVEARLGNFSLSIGGHPCLINGHNESADSQSL